MKIKAITAVLLLSAGMMSVSAQEENCNANSSISHEAVKAGNYKDAYEPWKAVITYCPLLRYYTYSDGFKILESFLEADDEATGKSRNSETYTRYFKELMDLHDLRMKYIPEFQKNIANGIPSVADALGNKAIAYLNYAPNVDHEQVYTMLKQSIEESKSEASPVVLNYFLDASYNKLRGNDAHKEQFINDYLEISQFIQEGLANTTNEAVKANLQIVKDNSVAMFINSGTATCESLEEIYAPKVEAGRADLKVLKEALSILKMMGCTESEVYFKASSYSYEIEPTVDAALGCGLMAYKKGDYDIAVKYIDEALNLETDPEQKADLSYKAAVMLSSAKRLSQSRAYAQKALSYDDSFGKAHLLIATLYATSPNWSDESALNKCTYFVVIDRLQRAKAVDSSLADEVNKMIGTYSKYTPQAADLFMLGYKAGDKVTIGGWIGETTTIR